MATNLRLGPETERAIRQAAARTGRSQQDLIREAVDRFLGLRPAPGSPAESIVAAGTVLPPRSAFRELADLVRLPQGARTLDLLDRDERR